jgi:nucleoid DNA-binding protein
MLAKKESMMMPSLTKDDLVEAIARRVHISQAKARRVLDIVRDQITEEVRVTGRFQMAGVGVFKKTFRAAKKSQLFGGPQKEFPAYYTVTFKPTPGFRALMNRDK